MKHDYERYLFKHIKLSGPLPDHIKSAQETARKNELKSLQTVLRDALGGNSLNSLGSNLKSHYERWFSNHEPTDFLNFEITPPSRNLIFAFLIAAGRVRDNTIVFDVLDRAGIVITEEYIVDLVFDYFQKSPNSIPVTMDTFNFALACIGVDYPHLLDVRNQSSKNKDDEAFKNAKILKEYYKAFCEYDKAIQTNKSKKAKNKVPDAKLSELKQELDAAKIKRDKAIKDLEALLRKNKIIS